MHCTRRSLAGDKKTVPGGRCAPPALRFALISLDNFDQARVLLVVLLNYLRPRGSQRRRRRIS
jgi:hypothetical protein